MSANFDELVVRDPDIQTDIPQPPEPSTESTIITNLERPLAEDRFQLGVEPNFEKVKAKILAKETADGKQYVWVDTVFEATRESLYLDTSGYTYNDDTEFRRPMDFASNPRFIKDDMTIDDINQGNLGDCWWLAGVAAISRSPKFMRRLIPPGQKMQGDDYFGMFHFRFWRFGKWVDVIVDDYLPVVEGKLKYAKSDDPNEFWLPLMEKAYAKLHGTYEAIESGRTAEALEDLTGGMVIVHDPVYRDNADEIYRDVLNAMRNESFVTCSIGGFAEYRDPVTGLVTQHAYTVTGAKIIQFRGSELRLIRIRNPWGNYAEWKGDWSDNSPLWNELDASVRASLEHADKDNGEWWMNLEDFTKNFQRVSICTIGPDFDSDGNRTGDNWYLSKVQGSWIKGVSAGGPDYNIAKWSTNPQYYLELKEADDFDPAKDHPEKQGKCSIIVGLMQEYRRVGKSEGLEMLSLNINAFKLNAKPASRLPAGHFRSQTAAANSGNYTNYREVSFTKYLDPGHYVLIPSTFHADKVGSFLIRVYTEKEIILEQLH